MHCATVLGRAAAAETADLDKLFENADQAKDLKEKARSAGHLRDHRFHNPECPGCQARARGKKKFKDSFRHDEPNSERPVITMDHVKLSDLDGTLGIGNFRYGIVICRPIKPAYWSFKPLKTMESGEATRAFKEFVLSMDIKLDAALVYMDAHKTLIKITDTLSMSRKHPPPGRPSSNAIAERYVGIAVAGIRAALTTGALPNCFWPFGFC